jgi:hypothetical protein
MCSHSSACCDSGLLGEDNWESGGIRELARRFISCPVIYPANGRFRASVGWAGYPRSYQNAICFVSLCQTLNSVRSGRVVSRCCSVNVDLRVATVAASSRKNPARFALRSVCLPNRVIRAVVNQWRRLQKKARPLRTHIASILWTCVGVIGCAS